MTFHTKKKAAPALRVLGIDPSSTLTGYALMTGLEPGGLEESGLLRPDVTEVSQRADDETRVHLKRENTAGIRRTMSLVSDVAGLFSSMRPDIVVVEVPSGKCGTASRAGASGSLTVYGFAAGAAYATCLQYAPMSGTRVVPVTEREWTQSKDLTAMGSGKKNRAKVIGMLYRERYDPGFDKGGDIADAIGIARWYLHWRGCRPPR